MRQLVYSVIYVAVMGILSNPLARLLPRKFNLSVFPFAPWRFENDGRFYEKLGVKKWKDRLPDMSKILKHMVPKTVSPGETVSKLSLLVQETCVSELIHWLLLAMSFVIPAFWHSGWAWLFFAVYNILGNLPYIVIQRYNRPRLLKLLKRAERKNG